jgi:hypothetical protein
MNNSDIIAEFFSNGVYVWVDDEVFFIRNLTLKEYIELNHYKRSLYKDLKYEQDYRYLTQEDALRVLKNRGICDEDIEKKLKDIERVLEDTKVELYKAYTVRISDVPILQTQINSLKQKRESYLSMTMAFSEYTKEGVINNLCLQKRLSMTASYLDGAPLSFSISSKKFRSIILQYYKAILSEDKIKDLCRSGEWRLYWSIKKPNPFNSEPLLLNHNQKYMIIFSRMYDSAYNHRECPSEDVINDNDALDGWFIVQDRKQKQEKQKQGLEDIIDKHHGNSQEIYIPARNQEEARRIYDANPEHIKQKILDKQKNRKTTTL